MTSARRSKAVKASLAQVAVLGRLAILALLVLLPRMRVTATAQGAVSWEEPFNVSNSPTASAHPAIVADAYGYVHVFWSEDMGGETTGKDEQPAPGNTILYRRWDGQAWSEPLDILAVAGDTLAEYVAATVDDSNRLHLVWTGMTRLYYSSAPAAEAYSPRAWSTPQTFSWDSARSMYESDVAVDGQGKVHIVYAERGDAAGVFHTMKSADSTAWAAPVRISDYLRENEVAFRDVRLVIDASDRLHAVWSTANTRGFNQAVYYARSEQSGESWDEPVMLADASINTGFTGFPYLLAHGQDELLLIHVDEGNKGRIERASADGGRTWSEPRFILMSMEGVNGFVIPLLDGAENLHLVINMRSRAEQRVGIYYAPRAELDWEPIVAVAVEEPYGPTAHYTDATIRLGNEIHVAWTQVRGGEIWYVRGEISGVPGVPAVSPMRPTPPALPTATPTRAVTATAAPDEPAPSRTTAAPADVLAAPSSSLQPVLAGVVPAALVVLAAVLWARRRAR